mgnify:CR=1 FL=1|tara:strand:+ start:1033 stop:2001 length:969 start_codon:yes stop_codon:yes gene_type:complete
MKILVTGCAGFIGFSYCLRQLKKNKKSIVYGIDNLNNYYDVKLKKDRLKVLKNFKNFKFFKFDIQNKKKVSGIIKKNQIKKILHLAAQAGVRYSIYNPSVYFDSNLKGFFNILKIAQENKIKHFVYASTSSVYGLKKKYPISEKDSTDKPLSFYAATKKCNEVLAYSFSNIYKLPCTGLRFFTVYGPYGRPDMALFKWTKAMINNTALELYNNGNHYRDFTYIDDVCDYIEKIIDRVPKDKIPYQVFNVGNSKPHKITDIVKYLKNFLNIKKPKIKTKPMQIGDVHKTHANIQKIAKYTKMKSRTGLKDGVKFFVDWFKLYF